MRIQNIVLRAKLKSTKGSSSDFIQTLPFIEWEWSYYVVFFNLCPWWYNASTPHKSPWYAPTTLWGKLALLLLPVFWTFVCTFSEKYFTFRQFPSFSFISCIPQKVYFYTTILTKIESFLHAITSYLLNSDDFTYSNHSRSRPKCDDAKVLDDLMMESVRVFS